MRHAFSTSAVVIRGSLIILRRGMDCLAVLDVSGAVLRRAQSRLPHARRVPVWIEADVTPDWNLKPME